MTSIECRELSRYRVDTTVLCEISLAETGDLTGCGARKSFYGSDNGKKEPRQARFDFEVRTLLVRNR